MNSNNPLDREYKRAIRDGDYHLAFLLGSARIEQLALDVEANLAKIRALALYYITHVRKSEREEA